MQSIVEWIFYTEFLCVLRCSGAAFFAGSLGEVRDGSSLRVEKAAQMMG
jgi:hypothetical protein